MRRARVLVLLLLAGAGLAACDVPGFESETGRTEQGQEVFDLWRAEVAAAFVIGLFVWGLIFYAAIRYRRRSDAVPGQRQYVLPIEVTYTIVPIVIVAVIFGVSYGVQRDVDDVAPDPAVVIEVTGFQWQWQFHYVDEDITVTGLPDEPPTMVLPVDATIRLKLSSHDVIHSFYVPDFLYKRDVIPGVDNEIDVDVTDEGTYSGACAEFCGLDHARMTFTVEAVSADEFDDWVAQQQSDSESATTTTTTGAAE